MHIIKGFLPWIIFSILARNDLPIKGCSIALLIYAYLSLSKTYSLKLLDLCSAMFFCGVIVAIEFTNFTWFIDHIMYASDLYLAIVILITIFIKKPFTLSYAKQMTSPHKWETKEFLQINMMISLIWFIYFCCSAVLVPLLQTHLEIYILLHVASLIMAILLTKRLPGWYFKVQAYAKYM